MGATHTLQDKLEPTIEALIADGTIAGVEVDRSLERATGAGYIADFLATTPSGAVIDIEVDHPAHHDKGLDDARDEALVVCGISTIRVSAFELDDGKAEGKIRDAIALCERTGKPLQAGSEELREAVGEHNLVSAQSVTQAQRVSEFGTNFAVLNELDPDARAFARDEAERARAEKQ